MKNNIPDLADILEAEKRIKPYIKKTPVLTCSSLDRMVNAELFFKCENFQKVGAFKFRGASNAVFSLSDEEAAKGVATHSSGNHAQALALAAKIRGISAHIVMPETAPAVKKAAVEGYGGNVIPCKPTLQARESTLENVVKETGAVFIHPYNDSRIIAGQATAAKELMEKVDGLDIIMAPVGGGGLLSGTALSASFLSGNTKVIAAEPEQADDAYRSFKTGELVPSDNPVTIADGLKTSLGDLTFPIIQQYVQDIVTVSERAIISSMLMTWERMKILIESSSAVPFGALFEGKLDCAGKKIGIILSGGNVDLGNLPWQK